MSAALFLGYAALLAYGLPRRLATASWTSRAPRLALAMWFAATTSVLTVVLLAAAVAMVPLHTIGDTLVTLVRWCDDPAGGYPKPPARVVSGMLGAAAMVAVTARVSFAAVAILLPRWRQRRRHRSQLRLLARLDPQLGVFVLDHPSASAFCLPGAGRQVVLTAGALEALSPAELDAVVAHERAHLRGRHDLLVAASAVGARAFPAVPLFRIAYTETRRLVELAADDHAARRGTPLTVALAVLRLSAPPPSALGMAGTAAAERVQRLLGPYEPLGRRAAVLRGLAAAAILAVPLAAAALPTLTHLRFHCSG